MNKFYFTFKENICCTNNDGLALDFHKVDNIVKAEKGCRTFKL